MLATFRGMAEVLCSETEQSFQLAAVVRLCDLALPLPSGRGSIIIAFYVSTQLLSTPICFMS